MGLLDWISHTWQPCTFKELWVSLQGIWETVSWVPDGIFMI